VLPCIAHETGKLNRCPLSISTAGSRHRTEQPIRRRIASRVLGTYLQTGTFLLERCAFMLKSHLPQSEYTMNIFYIIGVIVVVLFVAGFLGLR
jgi:hypothetical protein